MMFSQESVEQFFAGFLLFFVLASENRHDFPLCLCRIDEVDPVGADAMTSQEGVYLEGKVECRTACGHGPDLSFWGKDEDFGGEEVELDGIEEVHRVGLRVVQDFLDSAQPVVEFVVVFGCVVAIFVFPVGRKSLFGNFVHALGTYLYFCDVECLVAVGFWVHQPVAHAVGV